MAVNFWYFCLDHLYMSTINESDLRILCCLKFIIDLSISTTEYTLLNKKNKEDKQEVKDLWHI